MSTTHHFSLRDLFATVAVTSLLLTSVITGCDGGVSGDPIKITPSELMESTKNGMTGNPLAPAMGSSRRTAIRMQNATHLRGIQMAFVLYSNSNNGQYPGHNSSGENDFDALRASSRKYGAGELHENDISKIYATLLNGEFFTPEYIVSPVDNRTPVRRGGTVTNANYSFALLDMTAPRGSARRREWRDTNNSQAPVAADPSNDIRTPAEGLSTVTYHSTKPATVGDSDTDYAGNIAWNDNHVTFENDGLFAAGELKMSDQRNEQPQNPWKGNSGEDAAKFIW